MPYSAPFVVGSTKLHRGSLLRHNLSQHRLVHLIALQSVTETGFPENHDRQFSAIFSAPMLDNRITIHHTTDIQNRLGSLAVAKIVAHKQRHRHKNGNDAHHHRLVADKMLPVYYRKHLRLNHHPDNRL